MDEDGPYDRLDLGQIDDDAYSVVSARRDRVSVDTDEDHGPHGSLIDPRQIDDPTYANIERKKEGDPPKTPQSGDATFIRMGKIEPKKEEGPPKTPQSGDATFIRMGKIEPKKEEDPPKTLQSVMRRYQWFGVGFLGAVLALLSVAVPVYLYKTNMLERERLENRIYNLTAERNQSLDTIYNLTAERNQSLDIINCLKRRPCESDGFTLRDGLCYYVSTEKRTWEESRQWCRDNQSDLMVVKSQEKQDFVASFNMRVWLGLTDSEVEGSFQWVDGTPLTEPTFWFPSAPAAERDEPEPGFYSNAEEDCVEYYDGSHSYSNTTYWNETGCNDLRCNDHRAYWICEKPLC